MGNPIFKESNGLNTAYVFAYANKIKVWNDYFECNGSSINTM